MSYRNGVRNLSPLLISIGSVSQRRNITDIFIKATRSDSPRELCERVSPTQFFSSLHMETYDRRVISTIIAWDTDLVAPPNEARSGSNPISVV